MHDFNLTKRTITPTHAASKFASFSSDNYMLVEQQHLLSANLKCRPFPTHEHITSFSRNLTREEETTNCSYNCSTHWKIVTVVASFESIKSFEQCPH